MVAGDVRCGIVSMVALSHRLGGFGARLKNGGKEPALGPSGPTSLLRGGGGAGLQSLEDSADTEFLWSFAAIATSVISFCRKTEQHVYIRIAETLESLDDIDGGVTCPTLEGVREAMNRTEAMREPLSVEEKVVATDLVRETRTVEVPGRFDPEK